LTPPVIFVDDKIENVITTRSLECIALCATISSM
jgi:hypothetical protein